MLPLLAAQDLREPHFNTIRHATFSRLRRSYVLAVNRESVLARSDLDKVRQKLVELCHM